MIVAFTATWEVTEASATMMACVEAGFARWFRKDRTANEDVAASLLGVARSRISAMRSGLDPGPAFLRFASLPKQFWIGFLVEWGVRFSMLVITEHQHARLIRWLNRWMVRTMRRDMARMYSPEQIAALDAADDKRSA